MRIVAPPGVYRPRSDTALLAGRLPDVTGARVLELCTGSGALALTAAARGAAHVVAIDRSTRAVAAVRLNAALNGLAVDARRGDLVSALRPDERFDLVLANPPYVPVAPEVRRPDDRWDAGHDGRAVLDRILADAPALLAPGGRLLLVHSHVAGVDETVRRMTAAGLHELRRDDHRGPLGPVLRARRAHLRALGLLGADDHETLCVISARAA
ncbi:methyltransferase [Paraconexibacter algicola]|uniref:Methyltransferase n=1 Tax=Paraconexibacter algicola TaxID=2133960 RepID=A0A2T4UNI0_9ACTN|nr:methyltransferase [Paraconexibacter algicola]